MDKLRAYLKAIVAFFAAPLSYIGGQLLSGKAIDWRITVGMAIINSLLVWAVPNTPKPAP